MCGIEGDIKEMLQTAANGCQAIPKAAYIELGTWNMMHESETEDNYL